MKKFIKPLILLGIVLAVVIIYRMSPLKEVDFEKFYTNRDSLLQTVRVYTLLAPLIYIVIYIAVVALSIPGASVLTILGGFFFGPVLGTVFVNVGATLGAMAIFLISRYFLGDSLQSKYSSQLERFNRELELNGTNYLLTLRFIPLFPFFLINILAGLTKVPGKKFFWTTSVGIIPGSFIYAWLGYAGASLDETQGFFTPQVLSAFVLMGVLALVPVIIKKVRSK